MIKTIRLNSRWLPATVIVLLVLQVVFPHRAWVTALIALGGAWLIAYLWVRLLSRNLSLIRERRFGLAQVGDQIEERFTVTNTGYLPVVWFEMQDHSTLPGYNPSRALGVESQSLVQWTTAATCEQRGAYQLGPTTLQTGDVFGIYSVTIQYAASTPVFVMPPVVPLPAIQVAPGGRAGEGHPQPRAFERTVSASTVRQYVSGDDLRWVHWPTSARHDSFFVRTFENTPAGDWWIYLDLDRAVQAGNGFNATQEHAIMLAASLADQGLRAGRAVGLVAHGDSLLRLPPRQGNGQRLDIMRALALAQTGSVSLADLLTYARPPLRELASVIVITPNVSGNWIESLLPLLWRGAVPTTLLLDPVSYGAPAAAASKAVIAELANLSIQRYIITSDLLDRPEAHPGQSGLHWRVSPSGRAILTNQASELEWKTFSA